jgi:hypothetical protein
MRGVLLSLLAVLLGAAMVGGGIWGLISSDDDDDSASASSTKLETSSPKECAQVAERDPRFERPHDLQFGGEGNAIVQCKGTSVTFSIKIDALKESTFYEVVLEKGKREVDVGSILVVGTGGVSTVTIGPEIPLRKYDFLTVRPDQFHNPGVDQAPFSAAL